MPNQNLSTALHLSTSSHSTKFFMKTENITKKIYCIFSYEYDIATKKIIKRKKNSIGSRTLPGSPWAKYERVTNIN